MPDKLDTLIDAALAKYPKAKKIAVENFCWSAPDDKSANRDNVRVDADMYRWNKDTVEAIRFVLRGVGKL